MFGLGLAQREQVVVIFLRHGRARIVVDIVDGGSVHKSRADKRCTAGKTAGLVDDHARGIQIAHFERDAVFEAFETVAEDFVEHFPYRNTGMVAVALDHFNGFRFQCAAGYRA